MAINELTRKKMGLQAVNLARKVGYHSAGTVEFLVDKHKNFYFLEMNTRLQVEHPITEYVTGIDLVEQMIRVAANQKLRLKQSDIHINGWAFESRVYAEDPKLFLPSIGRLQKYVEPLEPGNSEIRCDSGIREGSEISIYYDPLICKLCTHGPNRQAALNQMRKALDAYIIRGVTHNIPVIREVISQDRFKEGRITTKYLAEEFPDGFNGHQLSDIELERLAIAAAFIYDGQNEKIGFDSRKEELIVEIDDNKEIFISACGQRSAERINNFRIKAEWKGSPFSILNISIDDDAPLVVQYHGSAYLGRLTLQAFGTIYSVRINTPLERSLAKYLHTRASTTSDKHIRAPMAGQLVAVSVIEGDTVRQGAELFIIEAMKMQNSIRAPRAAKVLKVHVAQGQNVSADQLMVELEFL